MNSSRTKIANWHEFEEALGDLSVPDKNSHGLNPELLFRGQSDWEFRLNDTLYRRIGRRCPVLEYYRYVLNARSAFESVTDREWKFPYTPDVAKLFVQYDEGSLSLMRGLEGYEFLLYLRHHGFPSPLLDWTRSPYIAAFFAFRESSGKDAVVYVLRDCQDAIIHSPGDMEIVKTGRFVSPDKRHYLQQSDYTVCVQFDTEGNFWTFASHYDYFKSDNGGEYSLHELILSKDMRNEALKQLDRYNMNAFSLFATPESLAESMAFRVFDMRVPKSHPLRPRKWRET